jgi:hypothetical protein
MSQPDDEGTRRAPRRDDGDAVSGPWRQGRHDEPDVLLEVADLRVAEISLEVKDLTARVSLQANVLDLLNLHVGVDAALGGVQLTIKGVEAEVLLKARLDNVARIIDRVLTTIDNNPALVGQLTEPVGSAVTEVGAGTADVVDDVAGAGSAVVEVGEPGRAPSARSGRAPQIVEDLGQGIANADADLAEDAFPQPPAKEPGSAGRSRPRAVPSSPQLPAKEPGSAGRSRPRAVPSSPRPPAKEPGSGERSRPRATPSAAGGPRKGPRRPRDRGPEEG